MQLADICELIIDCEHKTAPTQAEGFPSIRTPNIGKGHFLLEGVNRVSEETYNLWTKRAVPRPGDLIMAREAPVGNVAIIPEGLRPCLGQRTLLIRPVEAKVDPLYLTYLLNGPIVQGAIHSKTNGATVAHLNMKDVRSLVLPELPPLSEQKRIGKALEAYDELIENNQRRVRILEEMASRHYREWFINFRFPGFEERALAGRALQDDWHDTTLGDLASVITKGTTPTTLGKDFVDRGVAFVKVEAITEAGSILPSKLAHIDSDTHALLGRSQLANQDILFSIAGAIGRIALVSRRLLPANTNQALAIIRLSEPVLVPYILQVLRSSEFLNFSKGHIVQTAQANVSLSVLRAAPVVLPPRALLTTFGRMIQPMYDLVDALTNKIENLRRTRDLLLPRLLPGQIKAEVR